MAGTNVKRHREEEESGIQKYFNDEKNREAKRYKSYDTATNNKQQQALVSFLEQQEEDDVVVSSQELSLFLKNLQQELFSDPSPSHPNPPQPDSRVPHQTPLVDPSTQDGIEDDNKESVIRHLLEASDDELGLPDVDRTVSSGEEDFNGLDDEEDKHNSFLFCDGLWEIEDEAANYYTLLQSQLFM